MARRKKQQIKGQRPMFTVIDEVKPWELTEQEKREGKHWIPIIRAKLNKEK